MSKVENGFDRTYEELKPGQPPSYWRNRGDCFDRTYEELKQESQAGNERLKFVVLIVPMRN